MSDALRLPPRPNLEQYKKLARDLQEACRSSDPAAIRQWAERWRDQSSAEAIERRWIKLKASNQHAAQCKLAGAQFFIAREHGFTSWSKFAQHVEELGRANSPVSSFEAAADAIVSGDITTLRQLLAEHPGLVRERSTRDHRSTLLHYVSANGVEDFRQKTPQNIVEITKLLLDAGADVDAESDAYGGGCTPLGLVATSVHPEQAGVQIALLQTLLGRGASVDRPSAGGNKQTVVHACFANGQPEAARFLADLGAPLDVESAAALGRLDALRSYFEQTTDQRRIQTAFLYACGYGSLAAAESLLDRGVDIAARDGEGRTGLHWASWKPHVDVIRLLLERGAPVDAKDRSGATPLETVRSTLNDMADPETRERCYEAIALLDSKGSRVPRGPV